MRFGRVAKIVTFIIIVSLLVLLIVNKELNDHIKANYPEEWEKSIESKMGVNSAATSSVYLNDSMKTGFISEQNDKTVIKLRLVRKWLMIFVFATVAIKFALMFTGLSA
ncbi:hypothetical protein [Catenovulum maritimum]|uniref:Uncharacterized protein n=1 Tax=Catenovulum maritimum TaxID=1513271 RepID=A0A0J8GWC1_9ALTE|nr:hypothetical protein [Catenovulum maritimum]KMT64988.1 hypothetical protein XM47_10895 [Catenovulum maritimum]